MILNHSQVILMLNYTVYYQCQLWNSSILVVKLERLDNEHRVLSARTTIAFSMYELVDIVLVIVSMRMVEQYKKLFINE